MDAVVARYRLHFSITVLQASDKVAQIVDIWQAGLGVVSLHVFQNVIASEAFTREACMIDALGERYKQY